MAKILQEVREEDIGTRFLVTIKDGTDVVDLTGFTSISFIFRKPDKSILTKNATIIDLTGGVIQYVTILGDLDQLGRWKFQIALELVSWDGKSSISEFTVHKNL